jgi:hypothetical protein
VVVPTAEEVITVVAVAADKLMEQDIFRKPEIKQLGNEATSLPNIVYYALAWEAQTLHPTLQDALHS